MRLSSILVLIVVGALQWPMETLRAENVGPRRPVSFQYDVLALLSKQGCSAGACHGSPTGKGGFRLSLRGFDAKLDEATLVREELGRRVNRFAPQQSLLLRKPLMQVAHGGGKRLEENGLAYQTLRRWIAEGCVIDSTAPKCIRIETTPADAELQWPDYQQALHVTALFSDGSRRDITSLAIYSSSHEQTASVEQDGVITIRKRGEATVVVRFLDFVVTVPVALRRRRDGFAWRRPPTENEIDRLVFSRLEKLQVEPAPICTDAEFVRRVYLDLIGILPTRVEAELFARDTKGDKRSRLIDQLLERSEYASFWAQKRADLLRVRASRMGEAGVLQFAEWLKKQVAENRPYDQFARDLLTASGATSENPTANYYRAAADFHDCAETASQLFLGVRIQCAKCHNHPFDRWSQDNYYGIAAFFGQVKQEPIKGQDAVTIKLEGDGKIVQPRTGRVVKPWLPLVGDATVEPNQDRREVLANWLTQADNPFFARVAANRIWAELFGKGIVDPVDDFNASNPPSHPDLLDWLAKEFVATGYDQKHLIRTIANSRVYQLSSRTNDTNGEDDRHFSHTYARMLRAEQLLDAIGHVTKVYASFEGLPLATRATALPSPDFGNDFLKTFGQPTRNSACECERQGDPNLARALQLINGPMIPRKLQDRRSRVGRLFDNTLARVKAAGAPPSDGQVAWFSADAGVTTDAASGVNGAAVNHWKNLAAGHPDASQKNPAQKPIWLAAGLNGLPTLRFDGKNDFLHNTEADLLAPGAPRTVLIVGRLTDNVGGALLTFGRQRAGGASIFTAQHVQVGGQYYVYSDGVNGAGNTTSSQSHFTQLSRPFVTTFTSPGVGEKLRVRLNGEACATQQPGGVGEDQGSQGFTIGSREDLPIGSQIWHGEIAEVLVYDRELDTAQLQAAEKYLAVKYDLDTVIKRPVTPTIANLADGVIHETIVDCYYAAYSRPPSARELMIATEHIRSAQNVRTGLEDFVWAVLNSKEFLFQH